MGWTFPWLSSNDSGFNHDFGVLFTPEELVAGRTARNDGHVFIQDNPDMFGVSIFVKDGNDGIRHSYSTCHRGTSVRPQ